MRSSGLNRAACICLALALVVAPTACRTAPQTPARTIVLGIDGLDPQTIDLLMAEGRMPNFARLRQDGAYGRLISSRPILSPIIWTTIATGKPPAEHGIGHFVAVNESTGESLPVTSTMRKVKAVWEILSAAGRSIGVVGWWATWPAETVQGEIVSDHTCYHFLFDEGRTGDQDKAGLTHPPELADEIAPMIRRPTDLTSADVAPYVDVSAEEFARDFRFDDDLGHFRWALATAQSYAAIGEHLWTTRHPDNLMVYIEGVDSTSHLFGHLFRSEGLAGELAEQHQRYGRAVEQMYLYADRIVGRYLDLMDENTTLVVLSDHGFQLGVLHDDPSKTRSMQRVSERYHRIEGILYMYGRAVARHARIEQPTLLDITPTLLTLAGVSPAQDMPGRVLTEALEQAPTARSVATWEDGTRAAGAATADASVDPAILEHLQALGYLDTASPTGDRNMAAMAFQSGDFARAEKLYRALIEQSPDDGPLRTSLAGTLASQGRYDEALQELASAEALSPLNPETYHNRGAILERQGRQGEAVAQYRTALRYAPAYEPSQAALERLTGTSQVGGPASAEEARAFAIAQQAAGAARHGDYAAAATLLAEAEQAAPGYALVQQYRANVAWLAGDLPTAMAAMRRALELEPDNALYRVNLERLEQAANQTADPASDQAPPGR